MTRYIGLSIKISKGNLYSNVGKSINFALTKRYKAFTFQKQINVDKLLLMHFIS